MSAKPRIRVPARSIKMRPGEKLGVVIPFAQTSNPEVFDALANIASLAEEGIVDAIAIAVVYHNGGSGSCYSRGSNRMVLVGEVNMLIDRIKDDFKAERVDHN